MVKKKYEKVLDTDDYEVDYDKEKDAYRVSIFKDLHFQDEFWFDAYKEKTEEEGGEL